MAKRVYGRFRGETCRACGWWQFLTVAFQFWYSNISLPTFNSLSYTHPFLLQKCWILFRCLKNFLKNLQRSCSLVKLRRVNFGCMQSPVERQVSWDYKELYLRDDILLDAALKTDSGTRAMSGMTDLLLNLQCSKCPRQTLANTRGFNVERVFCRTTHWMCNVRKWA